MAPLAGRPPVIVSRASERPSRSFSPADCVMAGLPNRGGGRPVGSFAEILGPSSLRPIPLPFVREYGTFLPGKEAQFTDDLGLFTVAAAHFWVWAIAGAVFPVGVNSITPEPATLQIGRVVRHGRQMWFVNFIVVIAGVQPRLFGEAYVLQLMPSWVAILAHVLYAVTLGALQPLGRFEPYRPGVNA